MAVGRFTFNRWMDLPQHNGQKTVLIFSFCKKVNGVKDGD